MDSRNVFLYWVGKEYKLINILRNLIYLHSKNGKGYKVNLITEKNINQYITNLPAIFNKLCPAHQADFIRANVICEYGGIWLDSDTIVIDSLDSLFDIIDNKDGFFIRDTRLFHNSVFGSKKRTNLMIEFKKQIQEILEKKSSIEWNEIGSDILQYIYDTKKNLYDNYEIFYGPNNMYPIRWKRCIDEFINRPFYNFKKIIREYQPLVIIFNSVYKNLENRDIKDILNGNMPINHFINKSFQNMKLIDYDFIEIGTSNFDTLIEKADDSTIGMSIDIIKYYLDQLPNKLNVKKINIGISNVDDIVDAYYIPENIIIENKLPFWFKGCNCINNYHNLHIKHNVKHLCKIDKVNIITIYRLFYENNVRNVKFLKIDTEGHDTIILKALYEYIKYLPTIFYPNKILFESNEHTSKNNVNEIINLFCSIGYILEHRGYDTILVFNNL